MIEEEKNEVLEEDRMKFKCQDCKKDFKEPLKDHFNHKSIYVYDACPFCESEDLKELKDANNEVV